jgi:hypothetical protein
MTTLFLGLYHVSHPRRVAGQKVPMSNHDIEPFTVRCGASDGVLGRTNEGGSVNVSFASFAGAYSL